MPNVLVESSGAVTTLTLNRPERRNALNLELLEELCAALSAAEEEAAGRILILRGAGPVFCAGLDLHEAADPARAERSAELIGRSLELLAGSRRATIAVVQGAAVAGGAGLMSACDFVVAEEEAQFGYPEVRRGLVAGLVMTLLRRQLREREARELLLTGELFPARRALELGLVNRVVPTAQLSTAVDAFVASVLAGGPAAIARTKALLAELWPQPLSRDLARAREFHLEARNSAEAIEGTTAFREKRPPNWAPAPKRSH